MEKRSPLWELVPPILGFLLFVAALIGLVVLGDRYIDPRGSYPAVVLRDVTVYEFNATTSASSRGPTGPSYLNTSIQVTLSSRNPSRRIGISYFTLGASASYRGQPITPPTLMAAEAYQGHGEVIEWSPFLEGNMVPVSPGDLSRDLAAGAVPIEVKIDGRLKWRPDHYARGDGIYPLHINCPAVLMLNATSGAGAATGSRLSMKLQSVQHCTADVIM